MAEGGAPMPIVCDNGHVWINDHIFGMSGPGTISGITMIGCTSDPCPQCGATTHFVDGDYTISRDAVQIITRLPDDLRQQIAEQVREAREGEVTQDQLASRLDQVAASIDTQGERTFAAVEELRQDVRALAQVVRTLKPSEWRYWLIFVATLLSGVIGNKLASPPSSTPSVTTATTSSVPPAAAEAEIDRIVQDVLCQWEKAPTTTVTTTAVQPKVGRNASCPCGSGQKYKHCHGASPNRAAGQAESDAEQGLDAP